MKQVTPLLFTAFLLISPMLPIQGQQIPGGIHAILASVDSWEVVNREMVLASLGESNKLSHGLWQNEQHVPFGSELAAFDAITLPAGIELTWVTTQEFGTEKFAIERKLEDGRFATIYMADAAGTTNKLTVYRFLDRRKDGIPQEYRLRQIDQNGTNHFSRVIRVLPYTDQLAVLRPEIHNGAIELPLESRIVKVMIWNQSGEQVYSLESWEDGIQEISVRNWQEGQYAIQMDTESGRRSAIIALP